MRFHILIVFIVYYIEIICGISTKHMNNEKVYPKHKTSNLQNHKNFVCKNKNNFDKIEHENQENQENVMEIDEDNNKTVYLRKRM
jgi:hypothetical protein